MRLSAIALLTAILAATTAQAASLLPPYAHVVMVIEENHDYSSIYQNPNAPYINTLAAQGALFTTSFGLTHPSQPNYLDLFSGSNQGVTNNNTPAGQFNTPNLGGLLIGAGYSFGGYSQSLPSVGFNGDSSGSYVRKHNPWVNFSDVPAADNMPFTSFPSDFTTLPTVSIVVPDQLHDMHDGTIAAADTWLNANLAAYAQWALINNSLLILTFDEDDSAHNNHVLTFFYGANVVQGQYNRQINHFDILRTIEDIYGLGYAGASADATPLNDAFATPEPSSGLLTGIAALVALAEGYRRRSLSKKYSQSTGEPGACL